MLQVGHPAPSFSLPDASMEMMNLSSFRGKKNVVLYFYPKDRTPACTIQAIDFSDREQEFSRLDTVVFGISRDDVLETKVVDGRSRESVSRSTFIIDKKGILRHILRDVDPHDHADEVLKKVKGLNGRAR